MEWEENAAAQIRTGEELMTFLLSVQEALWYAKGFHPDLEDIEESDDSANEMEE